MSERDREQLRKWLTEVESDDESVTGIEDPDEVEEDFVEETIQYSDTEEVPAHQEVVEELSEEEISSLDEVPQTHHDTREFYIGRQKTSPPTRWYLEPQIARTSRTPNFNIIPAFHRPGTQGTAKNAKTQTECFFTQIDDVIIQKIVEGTNTYINKVREHFSRDRDAKNTDDVEIKSLLGMFYLIGVLKSSRRNVFDLWNNRQGTGCDAVYVTMSEHRFRFLMRCLRFDDVRTREQRKAQDKLAHIRDVFEIFVSNCEKSYKPTDYLTIDEQLVAFRGKCSFRQYMPKKPAKFGLKVYALVSASNYYATKLEVYVGKQPQGPFQVSNTTKDLVCRLVQPVVGSRRNITADNFFSSIPLAKLLLEEKALTYVGTVRKSKTEIPLCFLPNKDREPKSSLFGFHDRITLVSYVPDKNKAVCAISTMHYAKSIDPATGDDKKPCLITTYNNTKHGVDILDKMCKQYDVSRNSRRWPLTLFFHIMNVAGVNAFVIYKTNNMNENTKRKDFLQDLAFNLIKPAIQRRVSLENIPKEIRRRGKLLLNIEEEPHVVPQPTASTGRCFLCGRARNKNTRKTWAKCKHWVCPDHQKSVCNDCYE